MSATIASRVRVSLLNNVDLPTLGRPTSTIVGFMACPGMPGRVLFASVRVECAPGDIAGAQSCLAALELLHGDRVHAAVAGLEEDVGADALRACLDMAAVGGHAHGKAAVVAVEK